MPFEVFRRHQKKMLAFLALFAMVAFSLDFSLLRGRFGSSGPSNPVVTRLNGRNVYRNELNAMMAQRSRANRFMATLFGGRDQQIFGGLDDRSIVDALVLQAEADRLGIPADLEMAVKWLKQTTGGALSTEVFDRIYRQQFASEVTDAQLLQDIANQVRLAEVRSLPGSPPVTPLDVFSAYRDQYERVSAKLVAFSAEQYLDQVPQPSPGEVESYYERYKDALPDPNRDTPGFKTPRKIAVEYVMADPVALATRIEAQLTDDELRAIHKTRLSEFPAPAPELPEGIFAGETDLTPSLRDPFLVVRSEVARRVARERADGIINAAFETLLRQTLEPFTEKYLTALESATEGQDKKSSPSSSLPGPGDAFEVAVTTINQSPADQISFEEQTELVASAQRVPLGLTFGRTPALDRESAATAVPIGSATRGGSSLDPGTPFATLFFDDRRGLYEELELADPTGRRFLAWKVSDQPAEVPPLDQIKDQVARAWRLDKARALALQAADTFASTARQPGGLEKAAQDSARTLISTTPLPRLQPGGFLSSSFQPEPPRPSTIPQVPDASPEFIKALFSLQPGEVSVAPNQARTMFYVMTLGERDPAPVSNLYSPVGPRFSLELGVQSEANVDRFDLWMQTLREQAGLSADWVPPDEAARKPSNQNEG